MDKYTAFARPYPNDEEAEYYSRQLAQANFIDFVTYTYPEYIVEDFHIDLCENLEAVIRGDIQKLMIFAPPQHGKSETVSVRFPPFWLSKNPLLPVMICSYGASLANEKAGLAKDLLFSEQYRNLFPELFKRAPKNSRRKFIPVSYNTKIFSAGVRGAITGKGAGLGIVDDPVKNWQEAYSPGQRNAVWEWWKTTFRTRIWENGRIVIIMTRWHEDDLAGRILNTSGEDWVVKRYPALAESQEERDAYNKKYNVEKIGTPDPLNRQKDDPLAPRRYSLNALLSLKNDIGPRAWGSEYQANPKPVEGNMLKPEYLQYVDDFPREDVILVRYWDQAGTEGGGAATAGVLMARTKNGLYYIIDVVTGHWSKLNRENKMLETAQRDKEKYGNVRIYFEVEGGSGGKDQAVDVVKKLAGFPVHGDRPRGSKELRFESFCSQAEARNVFIVNRPNMWSYVDELLLFPFSTYKDQADATSGAFKALTSSGWTRTAQ